MTARVPATTGEPSHSHSMSKHNNANQRRFIADLKPGERVEDQVFLIASKDLRTTTNGSLYIHCVLRDRTGQLLARIWQATEPMYNQIPEGGFLRFKGRTESYKGSLQFIIEAMQPAGSDAVNLADFLPRTSEDVDQMFERVKQILRQVKDRHLLDLIKAFVTDETLMARFRKAPAAIQMHQAYLGGLLEHTRNVLELAVLALPRYPELDTDLVLTAVLLHDIGKTAELAYETSFAYTNEGQLVGHIVQAVVWIEEKIKQIEAETGEPFPAGLKATLEHLVLAHHGAYEFGSPKLPAMPEAVLIHHLDNLDAKVNIYLDKIASDPGQESDWTGYVPQLGTKIFKRRATDTDR